MSGLSKQSGQNLQHSHTFTGSAVNTDSKGSHSHTTNSQSITSARTSTKIYNSSNTEITQTDGMSAHATDGWFSAGRRNGVQFTVDGTTFKSTETAGYGLAPSYDLDSNRITLDIAHTHNMQHNHTVDISHTHGTDSQGAHTHSVKAEGTIGNNGGTECRPDNLTIRIWKRTA